MTHSKPPNEKEKNLWDWFTKDISRISKNVHQEKQNIVQDSESPSKPLTPKIRDKAVESPEEKPEKPPPSVEILDKRTTQKLKRGSIQIEYKLDLHGRTKEEAYTLLKRTLFQNYEKNIRTHLVVTGKGKSMGSEGILKKNVPIWLKSTPFSDIVHQIGAASIPHGGEGALYVFLRKKKD